MTLTLANGTQKEAVLISRSENRLLVIMRGSDDPIALNQINGVWVSEDCEPVQVLFDWQKKSHQEVVDEADCLCSHDLAARLIHMLLAGDELDELEIEGATPQVDATLLIRRIAVA
jgi:hypothetical protein